MVGLLAKCRLNDINYVYKKKDKGSKLLKCFFIIDKENMLKKKFGIFLDKKIIII